MIHSKYFNIGKVIVTHAISEAIMENNRFLVEVCLSLKRYGVKDWGELLEEDKKVNEYALQYPDDLNILAVYHTCKGKILIITKTIAENIKDNITIVCFPNESKFIV